MVAPLDPPDNVQRIRAQNRLQPSSGRRDAKGASGKSISPADGGLEGLSHLARSLMSSAARRSRSLTAPARTPERGRYCAVPGTQTDQCAPPARNRGERSDSGPQKGDMLLFELLAVPQWHLKPEKVCSIKQLS